MQGASLPAQRKNFDLMKNNRKRAKSVRIVLGLIVVAAVFLDLTIAHETAVMEGTYRLESEFTSCIPPATATNVAIVPSDYSTLHSPTARTNSLSYDQVEDMVRKAIELQGGLDDVILDKNKDGKVTVMLKPNIVEKNTPSGWGTNTDVRVIKALVKIIGDHTAGVKIYVAEGCPRSGYDDPTSTTSSWEASGYRALLTDSHLSGIDFELLNLNQPYSDLIEVDLGDAGTAAPHNYTYMIHKKELEADVYITVPVLKIHGTGITSGIKNQIGTAPGAYYGYNKCVGTSYYGGLVHNVDQRCWTTEEIIDLCQCAGIDFSVIDAIMCLEREKTYKGDNQVRFNTIIAGKDPVAVDHVCAKLMCLNPDDVAHITLAEKVGMGTNDPEFINVVGASINDVKKKVIKSSSTDGEFGQGNRTWLLSQAFSGDDISTEYIENEANFEPEALKESWSAPVYFFDDRLDLTSYYGGEKGIVTYAFTYFSSPETKEAEMWIGYDEDIKVYINGEEAFSATGLNVFSGLYLKKKSINIKQGQNTLLVKTVQKYGLHEFSLNICDFASTEQYEGNRVADMKFYTTKAVNTTKNKLDLRMNCYPNPTDDLARITYFLSESGNTRIKVYDMNGKVVRSLLDEIVPAGQNELTWNAGDLNPGTYICEVCSGKYRNTKSLVVR